MSVCLKSLILYKIRDTFFFNTLLMNTLYSAVCCFHCGKLCIGLATLFEHVYKNFVYDFMCVCHVQSNCLRLSCFGPNGPNHSVCPPDNAFPVEKMHSCMLPEICPPTMELRIMLRIHTHSHTHARMHAAKSRRGKVPGSREKLGRKKAFFHMFLLSDLYLGRLCLAPYVFGVCLRKCL